MVTPHTTLNLLRAAAVLIAAIGCEHKADTANPSPGGILSARKVVIDQLESLLGDTRYFRESPDRVRAFIARLRTDEPIPPAIVDAWYAHDRERSTLELIFYDESQTIRGFQIRTTTNGEPVMYDYVVYLEQSRNNQPLGIVSVEIITEAPSDQGRRVEVPVRKVPGGTIRTWIPTPVRGSPATICLLDAKGREHACTPLAERPAAQTQPASRSH